MLDRLKPAKGSTKTRKRVGRGTGSGWGKTAGAGHKGQTARSGGFHKLGFEGGQMPMQRRLPKRGFTNIFRVAYEVVNLRDIARIPDVAVVEPETMVKVGLIRKGRPVKVLAVGELERPVTIRTHKISAAAAAKVEKAGGKVEIIETT